MEIRRCSDPRKSIPAPAAPTPKFFFGNSEDFRLQFAISYQHVVFRSTPFNANLDGINTSVSYFLNDWFAVEGNTVEAFEPKRLAIRQNISYTPEVAASRGAISGANTSRGCISLSAEFT